MQYKNAPIQEAVFDIRVDRVGNSAIESYETYGKRNYPEYPTQEKRVLMGGSFKVNKDNLPPKISSTHSVTGVIFSQTNGHKKIQFRRDGYTFNLLKPYSNWNEFSNLAFKFWGDYKAYVKPQKITRIALRYINRVELPLRDNFDFDHYFNNVPKIPSSLEQKFNRFFLQMQVPCNNSGVYANITQTFDNPINEFLPFIIDIDVFMDKLIDPNENLRTHFDELRTFKNSIFESLVTDNTRSMFNK